MATKLETLIVELAVENKDLIAQLKRSSAETDKAMKEMRGHIEEMAEKGSKSVSGLQGAMSVMGGVIGGELVLGALKQLKAATIDWAIATVQSGVSAAMEQEDALNAMNIALARSGHYSRETSAELDDFASRLQATTGVADDVIEKNMALIQSLGNLDKDGLKKATMAAVDLAAVLGIDLASASTMVGKAAAGNVETFGRYGISIEKGKTAAESFANTLQVLERFQGTAAAKTKTYSGALTLLGATWGDLEEEIGNVVVKNLAVINVIKQLSAETMNTTEGVKSLQDVLREGLAIGLIVAAESMVVIIKTIGYVGEAIEATIALFESFNTTITTTAAAIGAAATGDFSTAWQVIKDGTEEVKESFAGVGEVNPTLDGMADTFGRLSEAAGEGLAQMRAGLEATVEPVNNLNAAMQRAHEEQLKRAEEGRELAINLLKDAEDDSEARFALLEEQHNTELSQLQAALDAKKITEGEYHAALEAMRDKRAAEEKKRADERIKRDLQENQQRLQAASIFFGGFAALAREGGRETFGIAKRLSQAQAIVDGVAAVQRALANPPGPPFNYAIVAGISAMTLANVSRIERQQFNKGGTVPGIGFTDSVPAMLTPQEEVVDRSTSRRLREFLSAAEGGGAGGNFTFRHEFTLSRDLEVLVDYVETKLVERQRLNTSLQAG